MDKETRCLPLPPAPTAPLPPPPSPPPTDPDQLASTAASATETTGVPSQLEDASAVDADTDEPLSKRMKTIDIGFGDMNPDQIATVLELERGTCVVQKCLSIRVC